MLDYENAHVRQGRALRYAARIGVVACAVLVVTSEVCRHLQVRNGPPSLESIYAQMAVPLLLSTFGAWVFAVVTLISLLSRSRIGILSWECITGAMISVYMAWLIFQMAEVVL